VPAARKSIDHALQPARQAGLLAVVPGAGIDGVEDGITPRSSGGSAIHRSASICPTVALSGCEASTARLNDPIRAREQGWLDRQA
jgi:hypothetical protein